MRILCFTDNHFCEYYSIVKKHGLKYSLRLENQLDSLNWLERIAIEQNCDAICCLGDFFDKPDLNEREITAVKDINWNNLPHYFLVGNHESSMSDLQYSSTKVLEGTNKYIISTPLKMIFNNVEFCFLPYVVESDRKSLFEYFGERSDLPRIILSHNDIKGIQMGPVISKLGFDISELDDSCDLCINGHLHNGQKVSTKVLNLGNLTGKDFGEDATKYTHNVLIIDTDTFSCQFIENPFAFNFYKIEIKTESDLTNLISNLKNNAIISMKCEESLVYKAKEAIQNCPQVIESRIIISRNLDLLSDTEIDISDLTLDHLSKFVECCKEKIEASDILDFELSEICR